MKHNTVTKSGFSIPEVIVAMSIIVLIILTATNLLVSSMRANRNNVNRIIAYNLAQEALEGIRNVRDGNWLQNQYWKGNKTYNFFGKPFEEDGKYIIERKHNLFTEGQCKQQSDYTNKKETVQAASPWKLMSYTDDASKLYYSGGADYTEYVHQKGAHYSGFKRWLEIKTIPYVKSDLENENKLKIAVTAVVEWEEHSLTKSIKVSTILTDWRFGTI